MLDGWMIYMFIFFFKQKTAYEMRISDWSSDVCSSDLLARFIENVRGVSLDPVLMRRNWLQAYDFASGRGAIFLGEYARARQPFARIGEQTASVQVTSVLRASNRSFQVKWTESEYERGSQTRAEERS